MRGGADGRGPPPSVTGSSEVDADVIGRPTQGFGRALYWSYVLSGGRIAINLAVSLLLARLLGPKAFGLLAMANVYIFFVEMLVRQGMPAALIQRPDLDRRHLDTAFWMVLGVIGVLIPASITLSGWWATVNNLPELKVVIIGLSPVLALRGLSIVQESQLRRQMEFRALALRTNAALVVGGATGITLALAGAGVWALVTQQVVMSMVEVVVLWTVSDWRPGLRFDAGRARELLGFSGFSSLAGIGVFLQNKVDALLIGLMFGPAVVGLYRMALRLTSQAVDAASGALQSVSLPELSRYATDPSGLNRRISELVRLASLMAVPAMGLLTLAAEPLLGLLGDEWRPAATALKLLCLAAVVQVPAALTGPLLQAAGRPASFAAMTWIAALVSGGSFVVVGLMMTGRPVTTQLTGLALSRLGSLIILIGALVLPLLRRSLRLRPSTIGAAVLPITVAVAGAVVLAGWLLRLLHVETIDAPVVGLILSLGLGGITIGTATLVAEPLARRMVSRVFRGVRGRWATSLNSARQSAGGL